MILQCGFCGRELRDGIMRDSYAKYECRNCQPKHQTAFTQLFAASGDFGLLVQNAQINEYYIIWKFVEPETVIYKGTIGSLEDESLWEYDDGPILKLNKIIELPTRDIPLLLDKLRAYVLFS